MTEALNQTALVTGASTGIGAVYADRLAHRGYDLVLVARDVARLEALAARLRDETARAIQVLPADLTDRADLARVAERLAGDAAVTLLVNNAGVSMTRDLINSDVTEAERLIALNVTAPTVLASAAGRAFVARAAGGGLGGAIINLSSVLALNPEGFDGVYSGSKAYILNLSQSLAAQYGGKGLYVQAVLPGATRTEIWARSGKDIDAFPAAMVMEADDLVDAALAGFDARETVTIPPLADADLAHFEAMQAERQALAGGLSRREPAERYRVSEPA
ncbi:SDR family NAD(P)-dependent oxidoreductase [Sphingomonas immobilis]|uniref:SDR family NAD(P)-dependent oxidoreductase n=1 Tax=Sphingomonas immobilis TaxID=3063997 RepID=A0ABT9A400_9SPHN|nr:SDR family NAD(P)-dependent oxidoreductase [Sphingomonas sp. CA1-15]MDO7844069.1 SDR family NAD(P)-dependent oxidoreductase [Sphingomonas sp. CA1-15]